MKKYFLISTSLFTLLLFLSFQQNEPAKLSPESEECLACHSDLHPGMVESWKKSLHSRTTPDQAMQKDELSRRFSATTIDEKYRNVTVGCYECHGLNADNHKDAFEHNGYTISIVVSPNDCAVCHPIEAEEYKDNLMANAYANLMENPVYLDLKKTINGKYMHENNTIVISDESEATDAESCLYCHGTKIEVQGMESRETDLGEMSFPVLKGWPNQGVGRINPDGSKGSCTSCHPRHDFSIETARKPYTCAECHKGPDVPAYKVYEASKHGNIFASKENDFDFNSVPWKVGIDFEVPTCAVCHASLITDINNNVIAKRTHRFNDRLAWRLFGVPYAHPHPISPDVSKVKNSSGLPLMTDLDSKPVTSAVINQEEQHIRDERMQKICRTCHAQSWVTGHFERLNNSIIETNELTLSATKILSEAWEKGYASGIPQNASIFDEEIERLWTETWLFYANSVRFSTAMGGGGDYGVYANGRFQLTNKLIEMQEWIKSKENKKKK